MLKSVLRYGASAFCPVIIALAPCESRAQARDGTMTDPIYGEIYGITRRADRVPIPEVEILVHRVDGSPDRAVSSNSDGAFLVPNLSPGVYELRASTAGFAETIKTTVEVGSGKVAKVKLIVDSISHGANNSA